MLWRMDLGFRGDVVDFYHKYRRGYPPAVIDALVDAFTLTSDDIVVDLGCGTGQLTLPLGQHVRAVIGIDPEPDMLARARSAASERRITNASWLLGADTDMAALGALLGGQSIGAVTIGQALHWMDPPSLFRTLRRLVRTAGGVAIVANGTPLWLQDNPWSHSLRAFLERWLNSKLTATCGTSKTDQRRYREQLTSAGFEVHQLSVDYTSELNLEQLVGGVYSALSLPQLPPPGERPGFAEQIGDALQPTERFIEHVQVQLLIGRRSASAAQPETQTRQRRDRARHV